MPNNNKNLWQKSREKDLSRRRCNVKRIVYLPTKIDDRLKKDIESGKSSGFSELIRNILVKYYLD